MPSQHAANSTASDRHLYEYAVVRYMPVIEREEFINVGLIMMCKRRRWIKVSLHIDENRIHALCPDADIETLRAQLSSFEKIASGVPGIIGDLDPHERFRWLTAVRSASLRTSRPHPGHTADLDATFNRLFTELIPVG